MAASSFDEDAVRLKLNGVEIPIVEDYSVNCGVLEVPAQFSITVGHGGLFTDLVSKFGPFTEVELLVRDLKVQVGETDGFSKKGSEATTMEIQGRDSLARIVDTEILDERTFAEKTFADLTRLALNTVGLGDRSLISDNAANQKAITGKAAQKLKKQAADLTVTGIAGVGVVQIDSTVKGEVGQTWWEILSKQYRHAGLFLWSTHDGNFVLSQPNGNQSPLARIVNRRGNDRNQVSIIGTSDFQHNTVHRWSECLVCGRAGGGKKGRAKILGRYIDDEMVMMLNPGKDDRADGGKRRKSRVIVDEQVTTPEQAQSLAKRTIAECRRQAWRLTYTVAGHSAPAIGGGRVVWQPDMVVEVIDDELGIEGPMYLESVSFSRKPYTQTVLHLMRIEDLIYAESVPQKLRKKRGVVPPDPLQVPDDWKIKWSTDPNEIERIESIAKASNKFFLGKFGEAPTFNADGVSSKPPVDDPNTRRVRIPK